MIHRTQVQSAIARAEIELNAPFVTEGRRGESRRLIQIRQDDLRTLVAAAKSASYHCISPLAMMSAAYESPSDYIEGA